MAHHDPVRDLADRWDHDANHVGEKHGVLLRAAAAELRDVIDSSEED